MILDKLENSGEYEMLHPLFKEAFDYLKSIDFSKTETGKTELRGKDLFVTVSDSNLKSQEQAKLEVHDKYIDIQLPISKAETFGWKARADLIHAAEQFNKEKDIQFFNDKYTTLIPVVPENFIIFFPEDGHAPCIGEDQIRKVVVKVRIGSKE
ncbi:MAG: YhcH/YjgK/YiaL family protein [Prevotella sp.]|jgi:YhcH/YjgK/YiaL family protein|nr:YhcH/YjgK/YiaL family protein [Prevotella sp.]